MFNLDDLSSRASQAIANLSPMGQQPAGPLPGVQLTPQATPPFNPHASVANIPPMLQRGHGLLDRINRALTGGDNLMQNYDYQDAGLTNQQVENARPGLLGSLALGFAGVSPRQVYQQHLDQIVAHQQAMQQVAQQHELLANRQAVFNQFPPPQDGNEESLRVWANKVFPMFLRDPEVAKELQPLVDRFAQNRALAQAQKGPQAVQYGAGVGIYDPTHANPDGTLGAFRDPDHPGQWITNLERGMTKDQLRQNAINTQEAEQRLELGRQNLDTSRGRTAAARFAASGGDQDAKAQDQFTQALATLDEALVNPAANKSAIINFAGSVDTRAQLRQGTLQFIQTIDPSYKGTVEQWFQTKLRGTLRPDQVAEMKQVIQHIQYEKAKDYNRRYNNTVSKVPSASDFIQSPSSLFGDILDTYTPPTANGAKLSNGQSADELVRQYRNGSKKP